jgi:trans-aconitate methyltransferase
MLPAADLYDVVYGTKDYAREAEAVDSLIRGISPHARTLLDVACGTGRHLEHLADRYEIEGLDASPEFIEGARRRLPDVPLHVDDMRSFRLGRTFDAVTCLFSAIGYARTPEDMQAAVVSLAEHVAPGGVLVIEPWLTPEAFCDGEVSLDVADDADVKVARACVSSQEGRISRLVYTYLVASPSGAEAFSEVHELGLFTTDEMSEAVVAAGLEPIFHTGGLNGRGILVSQRRPEV